MTKVAIVYAPVNDTTITITAFPTYKKAETWIRKQIKTLDDGVIGTSKNVDDEGMRCYTLRFLHKNGLGGFIKKVGDRYVNDEAKLFFSSYYGGCGECYSIVVQEIFSGKPLFRFSLD